MRVYFDSSAFIKRFVDETGSEETDEALRNTSELGLSIVCFPELISAFNRKLREKKIKNKTYQELKNMVSEDIEDADIINMTPTVLERTILLLEENVLRSLDAIHIASALEWNAQLFVSSDKRQVTAAEHSGLNIKFIKGMVA